jgi:hypothetical protein
VNNIDGPLPKTERKSASPSGTLPATAVPSSRFTGACTMGRLKKMKCNQNQFHVINELKWAKEQFLIFPLDFFGKSRRINLLRKT